MKAPPSGRSEPRRPVRTARHLADLDRPEQIRKVVHAALRILLVWVVLFTAYFTLPLDEVADSQPLVLLAADVVLFAGATTWSTYRVLEADLPQLRAVEAIGFIVPFFLTLFGLVYVVVDQQRPASFSEALDRVAALYFAVTVFATVGFGDITPKSATARIIVSVQMILDLVLLGVVIKVLFGAARLGVNRRRRRRVRRPNQ